MEKKIVISCMDRRLHDEVDREAGSIRVRNAGGNLAPISDSLADLIRKEHVTQVSVLVHTDCSAMGSVDLAVRGGQEYSKPIEKALVRQFRTRFWKGRDELERSINRNLQEAALQKITRQYGDVKSSVGIIETGMIQVPEIDHSKLALLIINPSEASTAEIISKTGLEKFGTYVVQVPRFGDALPDVELAIRHLHIGRIIFGITSGSEKEQVLRDRQAFAATFPDTKAELVDIAS